VELRPTTVGDLPALHTLFLASIAGVFRPHGFDPPAPPFEVFAAQQGHVLETGRSVVAERDGAFAGFAGAWRRDDHWFLASLFVAPERQGEGIGPALLDAVWDGDARVRRTITDAIQPVSNALYGRRGLAPVTPVLAFSGRPTAGGGAPFARADGDAAAAKRVAEIDRAAYGFDRAPDHAYWRRTARASVWLRDGEPVAYSYAWAGGAVGPVAGLDAEAAAGALAGELESARDAVTVRVPGSSRRLVALALDSGLRLSPTPGLLLVSGDTQPPDALAIGSFLLF
jgi:GNAT superfamily N-acetyltransferase